jgi:tetratricopeptide (TPR) repeat protein
LVGASASATPSVWVHATSVTDDDARWFEGRFEARLSQHLELLGLLPMEGPPTGLQVEVSCSPQVVKRGRDPVVLRARIRHGDKTERIEVKGNAEHLDLLTGALALKIAAWMQHPVSPDVAARFPAWTYPFSVHRFLGRASVRMQRGEYRQAASMYGRAQELAKDLWVPEAFEGRRSAEDYLVATTERDPNAKQGLAESAAERALVAAKNADHPIALRSLKAFLKYTPRRALRWQRRLDLNAAIILHQQAPWVVQFNSSTLVRLDPRSGVSLSETKGHAHLVAVAQDDLLLLDKRTLTRMQPDGSPRWQLRMPAPVGPGGTISTSGLFGLLSEDKVAWADLAIGELGQVATQVVPLAAGGGGVVVLAPGPAPELGPDVVLLRPGKKNEAWRTHVDGVQDSAMTRDRVVLVSKAGLVLLRSHDGRAVRKPIAVAAGSKILGAGGRYAALAEPDGAVALVDILAAERTATLRGPGKAVSALTSGQGVAVLFDTGDLIFFDRDGRLLDRAWFEGEPKQLLPGSPVTPGPVVWSSLGLVAVADVGAQGGLQRDIDGAVLVARTLLKAGNARAGLRVVTRLAQQSAGRIAEAEGLRCQLLNAMDPQLNKAAMARAMARQKRAEDPTQSVGPFEF